MPSQPKLTLREIFTRCGGRTRVAAAIQKGEPSIGNWADCPPPRYWPILTSISDLKYMELHLLWAATLGKDFTPPPQQEDTFGTENSRR